jgi:hypothetical protein
MSVFVNPMDLKLFLTAQNGETLQTLIQNATSSYDGDHTISIFYHDLELLVAGKERPETIAARDAADNAAAAETAAAETTTAATAPGTTAATAPGTTAKTAAAVPLPGVTLMPQSSIAISAPAIAAIKCTSFMSPK